MVDRIPYNENWWNCTLENIICIIPVAVIGKT